MIQKISNRLTEYLEFDNTIMYFDPLVRVFGGAIRDSIAEQNINDIDILCGSHSVKQLELILISNGYTFIPKVSTIDISNLYDGIHVISEPLTYMKGLKIVQIIRPRLLDQTVKKKNTSLKEDNLFYEKNFKHLIENVDISCCGLSFGMYKNKLTLFENYENSLIHCLNKVFTVNFGAKMYSGRTDKRTYKLESRGWTKIEHSESGVRDLKLKVLLDKENIIDKKIEYTGRNIGKDNSFEDFCL